MTCRKAESPCRLADAVTKPRISNQIAVRSPLSRWWSQLVVPFNSRPSNVTGGSFSSVLMVSHGPSQSRSNHSHQDGSSSAPSSSSGKAPACMPTSSHTDTS